MENTFLLKLKGQLSSAWCSLSRFVNLAIMFLGCTGTGFSQKLG